jgi:NADPH-dependent glutamate synthase beta subunit-like oxidoreductase
MTPPAPPAAKGRRLPESIGEKKMDGTEMRHKLLIPRSYLTTEGNKTGSWRFLRPRYEDKTAPCAAGCPAGEDIPRIEMLVSQGLFPEAWETLLRENPFPAVCGRVCFHPCEALCNRGEYDASVAIHTLERFLADTAARCDFRSPEPSLFRKERIAVIGGGPAGLAAARFLTLLGYPSDVFEAAPEAGGILRWGIPAYRLPGGALRQDIQRLEKEGVRILTGRRVDPSFLADAAGRYAAVILACGHGRGLGLAIPGEGEAGVVEGLAFLRNIREGTEHPGDGLTAVIGGGNTAVDAARSVVRLGGKAVILYRRRRQDMPAFPEEVRMALEEGVSIEELVAPAAAVRDAEGIVLTLRQMAVSGEEKGGRARVVPDGEKTRDVRVQRIIRAVGASPEAAWVSPETGGTGTLALGHCRLVFPEGKPAIVSVGDLVNETKSVAHAIASGKEAAIALDALLSGGREAILPRVRACAVGDGPALSLEIRLGGERRLRSPHVVGYAEINADHFRFAPRLTQPRLLAGERIRDFSEIDLKISAGLAIKEAERCFNCGLCNGCDNCWLYCPDVAVLREGEGRRIAYDYCKGCGICVVECPRDAMFLGEEGK